MPYPRVSLLGLFSLLFCVARRGGSNSVTPPAPETYKPDWPVCCGRPETWWDVDLAVLRAGPGLSGPGGEEGEEEKDGSSSYEDMFGRKGDRASWYASAIVSEWRASASTTSASTVGRGDDAPDDAAAVPLLPRLASGKKRSSGPAEARTTSLQRASYKASRSVMRRLASFF